MSRKEAMKAGAKAVLRHMIGLPPKDKYSSDSEDGAHRWRRHKTIIQGTSTRGLSFEETPEPQGRTSESSMPNLPSPPLPVTTFQHGKITPPAMVPVDYPFQDESHRQTHSGADMNQNRGRMLSETPQTPVHIKERQARWTLHEDTHNYENPDISRHTEDTKQIQMTLQQMTEFC
jgi:hypothetical protein